MQTHTIYSCPSDNKGFPALCGFKGEPFGLLSTTTSRQKLEQQHLNSWGKGSRKNSIWLQCGFPWLEFLVLSFLGFTVDDFFYLGNSVDGENVYPVNVLLSLGNRENPSGLSNTYKIFSIHPMT